MERQAVAKVQKMPTGNNHPHRQSARSTSAGHPLLELQRSVGNQAIRRLTNSPFIQAKLQISAPEDESEQEADRVADSVMRMPQPTVSRVSLAQPMSSISPLAQRETDQIDEDTEIVAPKSKSRIPVAVREDGEEEEQPIQRLCDECEVETMNRNHTEDEEEMISRSATTPHVPARVSANIRAMQGGGSSLPFATRAFFEPRFGADFSQVRIHTDQRAAATAKSINARAFTVGRDIAFGAGQNSFESQDGRKLLAHELTHVVRQKPEVSTERIQRDDEPAEATKGPKELLEDVRSGYGFAPDDENLSSKEKAENRRGALLLQAEIDLHDRQPGYTAEVINDYPDLEDYVIETTSTIHEVASSETKTIDKLIVEKDLEIATEEFAWNPFFAENVAAFPQSFLELANKLLDPPYDEGNRLMDDAGRAQTNLQHTREQLPDSFFNEGLPVGRELSLILSSYELIKGENLRTNYLWLMKKMPSFESDLDPALNLEKKDPPRGLLAQYQSAWIGRAINLYGSTIFATWNSSFLSTKHAIEAGNIEAIDPVALRAFQEMYPQGLTRLDDLFQYSGAAASTGGSGDSPFAFYSLVKLQALPSAAQKTSDFIAEEHRNFEYQLLTADARVRNLSDVERLGKALAWSVQKGFAAEGIMAVVDNFGNILTDILEEKVKKSLFRRIVSFVASLHPLGRLAVLAYNIYQTVEDIKGAMDILSLIRFTVSTIETAKNASSVIDTQRSAAQMSKVYEEIIPLIAQKISAGLAKKLMKGSEKKRVDDEEEAARPPVTKPTTPHERKRALDESKGKTTVDELIREPKYLLAELDAAGRGRLQKSTHPDYEVEVTLPNKHVWRRNAKGIWCRFTEKSCVLAPQDLPEEMRKQLKQLDEDAEEYKSQEHVESEGTEATPGSRPPTSDAPHPSHKTTKPLEKPERPRGRPTPIGGTELRAVRPHLAQTYPKGTWEYNPIFENGKIIPSRKIPPKGTTRPDHYNAELKVAVEDKNYNIAENRQALIQRIKDQQAGRFINLPPGTTQWLFIDFRGQPLSQYSLHVANLRKDLGGHTIFSEIHVITETGIMVYK